MIASLVNKISPENHSGAPAAAGSTAFHSRGGKWAKIDPRKTTQRKRTQEKRF
jgi:hypothetical protein